MKKALLILLPALLLSQAFAADPANTQAAPHRYVIERTFPAGALQGLHAARKAKIVATNTQFGVRWIMSYANTDKTKTYCVYEGPSETAVRQASAANMLPVDSVTEVPETLSP